MRFKTVLSMVAGFAAALFALSPGVASAQTAPNADQTLAQARAALTTAQSSCNATSARFAGTGTLPKADGARGTDPVTLYEVVCEAGPGYLVVKRPAAVQLTNCLLAATAADQARAAHQPVGQTCTLPENVDAKRALAPLIQAANIGCAVDAARLVGRSAEADRYEVGCPGTDGYWIETNVDNYTIKRVLPCIEVRTAGAACTLTTAEEQMATLNGWATAGHQDCAIGNSRYVGGDATRRFYEVACNGKAGFMIRTSTTGEYQAIVPCDAASGIAGGCRLTEASVIAQATGATYAQRLQTNNIACAYQTHRVIGAIDNGARRVVEYTCSDRPLGLVAFLPEEGHADARVESFDCIRAEGRGSQVACTLTPRDTIMAGLTRAMAASSKPCDVTNYRVIGLTGDGDGDVLELKCAAGTGYIAEVPAARARVGTALTCAVSAQRGGDRCEL